ncbi:hypothetical protein OG884_18310 [Streptosporangium sp. NBC_01755]|uniref:hypothetical protein n=1 Tax=unclassified Streptosporangium TaxID=2632669 RepID=UPI002DD8DA6F|nr:MULTISPECIES: hypothetical protein [unclassified Streptosporangium]WSA23769.1 hypothetical protein OIE13_22770 [Streptosporangium sp. NBC_01810]WSD03760.1 hypothetical protein OG884_18310 [Streptosporangium sp. NBC_01755]
MRTEAAPQPADRVLAAVAQVLVYLGDVPHDRVIMAAAVLARRQPELTSEQAVITAANGMWDADARAAWNEGRKLLDEAEARVVA